jgi:hypothetical protein
MRPMSRNCCVVSPSFFSRAKWDATQKWHLPTIDAASA